VGGGTGIEIMQKQGTRRLTRSAVCFLDEIVKRWRKGRGGGEKGSERGGRAEKRIGRERGGGRRKRERGG